MSNLLPEKNKNRIKKEYQMRLATVALIFVFFGFTVAIIFLAPSYILLQAEFSERSRQIEEGNKAAQNAGGENYISALTDSAERIAILEKGASRTQLLGLISKIVDRKVPGVYLKSIDYVHSDTGAAVVTIIGTAATRDILIAFKDSLAQEKLFQKVDNSISDLVQREDISFTLNIGGNF